MMAPSSQPVDCQRCGACCVSPAVNRKVGYVEYISVDRDDDILKKPDLAQRYVTEGMEHALHLKLNPDGRCKALRGAIGGRVRCEIYHYRPGPCRRVELGTELCHMYRRDQGLEG